MKGGSGDVVCWCAAFAQGVGVPEGPCAGVWVCSGAQGVQRNQDASPLPFGRSNSLLACLATVLSSAESWRHYGPGLCPPPVGTRCQTPSRFPTEPSLVSRLVGMLPYTSGHACLRLPVIACVCLYLPVFPCDCLCLPALPVIVVFGHLFWRLAVSMG